MAHPQRIIDVDSLDPSFFEGMDAAAFDKFADNLIKQYGAAEILAASKLLSVPDFGDWVLGITLDGKPFKYEKHEYLVDPYKDDHPYQVDLKATQMCNTSRAMLRVMFKCRYGDFRNILYFFPSRTDVSEFSKGRITPLIQDNPETIGSWIRDSGTDSTNIKYVWNTFLYFRGMRSRLGMKSTPGDFIVVDELDEGSDKFEFWLKMRMAHSEAKFMHKLSNPTLPDFGIDREFQTTDQNFWLLKCDKCGGYTNMVDDFPECLVDKDGRVIRLCMCCRDRELNPAVGEWVAKRPGIIDKRGRQYSQLWSQFVDPADIMADFRTTKNISDFYNLTIGLAHVEAENRLSVEEVLKLCGSEGIASADHGPCSMGVDQGKDLHVVIGKRYFDIGKIVHIGVYKDWKELDRLMNNFHVSRCVVDALPELRNAREFSNRFPGRVYLNIYNVHSIGTYAWNDKDMKVQPNRTESLDASHQEISYDKIILPRESDVVRDFAKHLHNTAKRLEEETRTGSDGKEYETGNKRYVYIKLGEDHFRHAFNYETMARQFGMGSLFGGWAK